jgi:putative phosphonate metabolism protein
MASTEARYAIYFVPGAETALYRFGTAVLGYDTYTGRDAPCIATAGSDWSDKVREPRVYGFHATLKPPFRLAAGADETKLKSEFDAFIGAQRAIDAGPLEVRALGSFIALVPAARCPALDQLAADCVQHFDRFRAPTNAQERARRLAALLTERQVTQLDRWGYPYVFDDFRFHMTLTGRLAENDRTRAMQWLTAEFAGWPAAQRLVLDRMVIARQAGGAFRVVHSAPLGA